METPVARSTLSASAITSGPMPSPPTTASLIVREPMPEPYWRGGRAEGRGRVPLSASPPLSRRSRANCTASVAGESVRPGRRGRRGACPGSAGLSQGYMSYTRALLIAIQTWTYGQQQAPAAGRRPAFDQAPLRLAKSTTRRIVPATLPQPHRGRLLLKTGISASETRIRQPAPETGQA